MALADEVQARYTTQQLVELTNPRDPTATTVNTTKLGQAVTSVEGWFKIHVQEEPDATDARHLEILCDGVIACLQKWGGSASGVRKIRWDDWLESCRDLKNVGARAHEAVVTDSVVTPSVRTSPDGIVRPHFDDSYFARLTPNLRGASDDVGS